MFFFSGKQFFGLTHALNHLFHMFYRDHAKAKAYPLVEQFGDTRFEITHNLVRAFFTAEMNAQIGQIVLQ